MYAHDATAQVYYSTVRFLQKFQSMRSKIQTLSHCQFLMDLMGNNRSHIFQSNPRKFTSVKL